MDTKHLVGLLGGPSQIMEDTGLSKGRVSQWVSEDRITPSWLKFYRLKRPDIDWGAYDAHLASLAIPEPDKVSS